MTEQVRYFKGKNKIKEGEFVYYRIGRCWDMRIAEYWSESRGGWILSQLNVVEIERALIEKKIREIKASTLPYARMRK